MSVLYADASCTRPTSAATPTALHQKDPATGGCEPAEPVSPDATYLRLGAALGPNDLPELERTLRE